MNKAKINSSKETSTEVYNNFLQSTELLDICIQAERCITHVHPAQINPTTSNVHLEFEYDWVFNKEGNSLSVLVTGEFRSLNSKDNIVEAEFKATYVISYKINTKEIQLDENIFDLFSKINATIQAIPYFREFFQSAFARFGLPTFLLPMLKPGFSIDARSTKKK